MKIKNVVNPHEAWVIHREEVETTEDGVCDTYVLLDVATKKAISVEVFKELPNLKKMLSFIKDASKSEKTLPKKIFILKTDPLVDAMELVCQKLGILFESLTKKETGQYVDDFSKSFAKQFKYNTISDYELDDIHEDEIKAFVPDSYGPCPCASGKKYKFCCQKIFKNIVNAMCDAQDGYRDRALGHMKEAEAKVGPTAEVLCRYAICWSYFNHVKTNEYIQKALKENPNHPRTNYLLGIDNVKNEKYSEAISFYQKAIDNYPIEDRWHLNETYNNLGTAYFHLNDFKMARESWEKAVMFLPTDKIALGNLIKCIYSNSNVPEEEKFVIPFIEKYLKRK